VDKSGAPIADAKVYLTLAAPGQTNAVVHAGQDGAFTFSGEPLKCELTVSVPGYKNAVKTIDAGAGHEFNFGNIVMEVGEVSMVDPVFADDPGAGHEFNLGNNVMQIGDVSMVDPVFAGTVPFGSAVAVEGLGGTRVTLSVSDLSKLPRRTIKATDHGAPVKFEGVLLKHLLAEVDQPTGEKFQSTAASYYVVVEGKDGYCATFAWAELDPTITDKSVYLVTKRDGKPLPDKDGPFQLVVPDEKRAARWVRQVTTVRIQDAN